MRELKMPIETFWNIKPNRPRPKLATQLEQEQKGERFTLIEPPMRPEDSVSPNRPLLFILAVILSVAAGVGSVFI